MNTAVNDETLTEVAHFLEGLRELVDKTGIYIATCYGSVYLGQVGGEEMMTVLETTGWDDAGSGGKGRPVYGVRLGTE